jgi:glycosyltransferase involved in cell wall biosynthesis
MRIGFDARWYNGSGVGTYVKELLNALAEISRQFDLLAFEDPANPVLIRGRAEIAWVPVRSSTLSLASQFELRALCTSLRVDLLHVPYQYGAPLLLPCPLVVTMHDLIPFLFRTRSWPKQLLVVPWVKLGYHAAALRADHIIADSANTARDIEMILGVPSGRITPIHLAASADAFHPEGDVADATILEKYGAASPYVIVGSAGNWRTKNLETTLRALAIARDLSGIAFRTVVYGPERGFNLLAKRKATFGLEIRQAGYVPVGDLSALFRNAELFVMGSFYEGFGLPVLEAMSCGCPVVCSNGGSLGEVAGDGAFVFDPMDACGMAEAIALLLSSPHKRKQWRSRALARAAEFSWHKAAQQTLEVYGQVLHSRRETQSEAAYSHD